MGSETRKRPTVEQRRRELELLRKRGQEIDAEHAWFRFGEAAARHVDSVIASFGDCNLCQLKEAYKLIRRPDDVRGAILVWAKDLSGSVFGGSPLSISGKLLHPPALGDDGNFQLPDEQDLAPYLYPYVRRDLEQGRLRARGHSKATIIAGKARLIAPEKIENTINVTAARRNCSLKSGPYDIRPPPVT